MATCVRVRLADGGGRGVGAGLWLGIVRKGDVNRESLPVGI